MDLLIKSFWMFSFAGDHLTAVCLPETIGSNCIIKCIPASHSHISIDFASY